MLALPESKQLSLQLNWNDIYLTNNSEVLNHRWTKSTDMIKMTKHLWSKFTRIFPLAMETSSLSLAKDRKNQPSTVNSIPEQSKAAPDPSNVQGDIVLLIDSNGKFIDPRQGGGGGGG